MASVLQIFFSGFGASVACPTDDSASANAALADAVSTSIASKPIFLILSSIAADFGIGRLALQSTCISQVEKQSLF
jgi:hypothetical protein